MAARGQDVAALGARIGHARPRRRDGPAVDEVEYDELTRRRIERAGRSVSRARPVARRTGRVAGGGAMLTAVAFGLRDVLDPDASRPVIEEIRPAEDGVLPAVVLLLVPGAPRLSRALVRPWLL